MATTTMDLSPRSRPHGATASALALIGFVLLCQLAGATGALVTDAGWYRALDLPPWAPPGLIFGPVWISLYTLMGIAAWLVWRSRPGGARRTALTWFGIQLALNALWTPVFFGLRSIGSGLLVIGALLLAIGVTLSTYRRCSRPAALLMAPYLAWVAFATALNAAIWVRA